MVEKIRNKMKEAKGFTLVELIVVLVILAILAALLVPALTGYIDKANKEKITAECRQVVMAAQTEASTLYGKASGGALKAVDGTAQEEIDTAKNIHDLSETKGSFTVEVKTNGHVSQVTYMNSGWEIIYTEADGYKDPSKTTTLSADSYVFKVVK